MSKSKLNKVLVGRGLRKAKRAVQKPSPVVVYTFDQSVGRFRDTKGVMVAKAKVLG